MPASRQRSASPFSALAVSATIGVRGRLSALSSARIWRVSSKPSMSGMWMSVSTSAWPRARHSVQRLDAVGRRVERQPEHLELADQHLEIDSESVDRQHADAVGRQRQRLRLARPGDRACCRAGP